MHRPAGGIDIPNLIRETGDQIEGKSQRRRAECVRIASGLVSLGAAVA